MRLQEAREFVARFNLGDYSPDENAAFQQWLTAASEDELTIIADTHESMQDRWALSEGPTDEWIRILERKLDTSTEKQVPVLPMRGRKRAGKVRWVAAASAAVLLTAVAYFYEHRSGPRQTDTGTQLLSVTVSTPRGGAQKAIVLPDGSRVWLNAGSILRYPAKFPEGERLVALDGEAFFDVAGTAERPFRVRIKDADMEVLGTCFDVMAYPDEPSSRTTLVSGELKITSGHNSEFLHPGEAAIVNHPAAGVEANIVVQSGIDTNIVMAWKAGIYHFQGTDLRTILRVLSRNYNLDIHYQPGTPDPTIDGSLDLHKNLNLLLEQLQSILVSHKIQLSIDEQTLMVSPI